MASKYRMPYSARAASHPSPVARRLLQIAHAKRTNLIVAAGFRDSQTLLRYADALGPYIAVLQPSSAAVQNFTDSTIRELKALAARHNFLIYESCRSVDTSVDSIHQHRSSPPRIWEWADIIAVAAPEGGDALAASLLQTINAPEFPWRGKRALVMAPDMSSRRAAALGFFTHDCVGDARANPGAVMGFVAPQGAYAAGRERYQDGIGYASEDEDFVHLSTPGPACVTGNIPRDHRQLSYPLLHAAVRAGADFVVVGPEVCAAKDPVLAVRRCRADAWAAYEERLPPMFKNAWVKRWETQAKHPSFGDVANGVHRS